MDPSAVDSAWEEDCYRRERSEGLLFALAPVVLHPLWICFDALLEPAWRSYVSLRVLGTLAAAAVMLVLWQSRTLNQARIANGLAMAVVGVTTALLVPSSEHYWPYVVGYSLVTWGAASMFSAPWRYAIAMQTVVAAGFVVAHLIRPHDLAVMDQAGATVFVFTAAFTGIFPIALRLRLRRTAFEASWRLDRRNAELRSALTAVAQAEAQLRRAKETLEDEVAARTEALSVSLRQLEVENAERIAAESRAHAANEAKSAFLATMSHELRTPLNAIIGYTEMVVDELQGAPNAELCDDLEHVDRSAHHLLGIIDDILNLSRIEAGRLDLCMAAVPLRSLLDEAVALVAPEAAGRPGRIEIRVHDDEAQVWADAGRLRQVVANLLSNAVKFGGDDDIEVGTCDGASDREIDIYVVDRGIGIPESQLAHVFDRFYQVDGRTTREHDGAGLGLAISREYVDAMGGHITLQSEVGVGTTVRVHLCRVHALVA